MYAKHNPYYQQLQQSQGNVSFVLILPHSGSLMNPIFWDVTSCVRNLSIRGLYCPRKQPITIKEGDIRENLKIKILLKFKRDRLCGLVVKVHGYRSRDPEFDSRRYQIFWEVVDLERVPLSLVRITEELREWKNSGSRSRKSRITAMGIRCPDHATPSIRKIWH
jgi:hypothetical protein